MIAIDTNVLIRLIVNDPEETKQITLARTLLADSKQVYIPQIVQVEMVWVLESAYHFDKDSIIKVLEHIYSHPVYNLQNNDSFNIAVELFKKNKADFSDCLILAESKNNEFYPLYTFDKKLSKVNGAQLVS